MGNNARITISDIARAAHVSKMSVSRVLNEQPGVSDATRQRILSTMQSMGYAGSLAARALRGSSKVLGLVLPSLASSYMGEVLTGISIAAEQLDYGLMLNTQSGIGHTSRTNYYASLLSNGLVDGVILVVPYDYEMLIQAFKDHQLPYVIFDHHDNTDDEPAITTTNRK